MSLTEIIALADTVNQVKTLLASASGDILIPRDLLLDVQAWLHKLHDLRDAEWMKCVRKVNEVEYRPSDFLSPSPPGGSGHAVYRANTIILPKRQKELKTLLDELEQRFKAVREHYFIPRGTVFQYLASLNLCCWYLDHSSKDSSHCGL